ncbi:MAG: amidohydrolase family protein [Desulfobacterales bacterium]|nr:MAG: amidohydrolase family protein [Desulfobacterales bacterium]
MPDFLDLIIRGNILTMCDARPRVEAVGIKNGMIEVIGDRGDVEKQADGNTRYLALEDKTVIPGFIETHMHPTHVGNVLLNVDLAAASSISDILEKIRQKKDGTPPGEPILGLNFNYDTVKERRLPTREELDKLSSEHPIIIWVYDVHSAMLNTRMLEKIGLQENMAGYVKDDHGAPTGLVEDPAIALVLQKLLPENESEIMAAVEAAVKEALSVGITTLHIKESHSNLKAILNHEHSLPIRIKPMVVSKSPNHDDLDEILQSATYRNRAAVAFFADGAPDSKTAAFFEPYCRDLTNYGMLYYQDQELEHLIEKTHRAGFQISVHACGTRAAEQVLNIYRKVLNKFPRSDHRHRIEHFEMPLGDQIKRAVDLELALAMQPMFLYLSGEGTYENIRSLLGNERVNRWKPFRSILDAGGLIGGGSDAPVTKMSPLKGIQACILHPNERQRITLHEALKMFTVNAARIGFEEKLKGSIEPGKLADFTVLDDNPFSVKPREVGEINVAMTIVGGNIVFSDRM